MLLEVIDVQITPEDQQKIQDILSKLNREVLQLAKERGAAAMVGGASLSKVPEFVAAHERIGVLESLKSKIEDALSLSEVVSFEDLPRNIITMYSLVRVIDENDETQANYYLGHLALVEQEALPNDVMLVSGSSPIGQALLDKTLGQSIRVQLPNKATLRLRIVDIQKQLF